MNDTLFEIFKIVIIVFFLSISIYLFNVATSYLIEDKYRVEFYCGDDYAISYITEDVVYECNRNKLN